MMQNNLYLTRILKGLNFSHFSVSKTGNKEILIVDNGQATNKTEDMNNMYP